MTTPKLVWISSAARVGEMPMVYTKTFSLQLKTIKSSAEKLAFPIPNTYLGKTQKLKTGYHYRLCYRNVGYTWPTSSNLICCNAYLLGTVKLSCLILGFKIRCPIMYSYFQEYHHREHEQILGAPLGGFMSSGRLSFKLQIFLFLR